MNFHDMKMHEQLKPALRLRRKNLTTYGSARGLRLPGTGTKYPK